MAKVAFVLGNGESRRGIDINELKKKGTVYACNGVYRTHQPDYLIAVDPKMVLEIAESDYVVHNKVWSNYNVQYAKHQKLMDHCNWFKPSLGWSSGPTALRLASEHGYDQIYILGFDYQGNTDPDRKNRFKFNNVFKDTRNYKKANEEATFYGNWMNQTKRVLADFPNVKYHRVIPQGWFKPKDIDWQENLTHTQVNEFTDKFELQLKI
jgi:hypothetical protein|tara:strand:+ start:1287 stop:1913 length:627 start_codon:yes stop_codon:yes gene_type:complete